MNLPVTVEERIYELAISAKLEDITRAIKINKSENQVQHTVIKKRITDVQDSLTDRITELSITVDRNEFNKLIDVEVDRKHMKGACADTDANLRALENRIIRNDEERVSQGTCMFKEISAVREEQRET